VVCRMNPNAKLHWEPVSSSTSSDTANMLTSTQQHVSVPPTHQYLGAPSYPQYLAISSTPAAPPTPQARSLRLPLPIAPPVYQLPWISTPSGFAPSVPSPPVFLELMHCPLLMETVETLL
jgi:hypothetical protein